MRTDPSRVLTTQQQVLSTPLASRAPDRYYSYMSATNDRPQTSETDDDARISAAVRALAAGTGLKNAELAPVLGIHRASVFAKLKGETSWKASEVASLARYFDVPVGDLFDGLGLFRETKKPHRMTGGASSGGAPSGTRTPDLLIKSQPL